MSTVPDFPAALTPFLNALIRTTAANEDSIPESISTEPPAEIPKGWEPYEVWLRMIKEPRDSRLPSPGEAWMPAK